jgi:hypothetical protein
MLYGKYQITEEQRRARIKAMNYAIGSVQLEGLMLDERVKAIYNEYAEGNITAEEEQESLKAVRRT